MNMKGIKYSERNIPDILVLYKMNIEKNPKISFFLNKRKRKRGINFVKNNCLYFYTNIRPQIRNIPLKLRMKSPSFVPL